MQEGDTAFVTVASSFILVRLGCKDSISFPVNISGFSNHAGTWHFAFHGSQGCTRKTAIILTSFLILDFLQITEMPKMKSYVVFFFIYFHNFSQKCLFFGVSSDLIHGFPTEFRIIANKLAQGEEGSRQDFRDSKC